MELVRRLVGPGAPWLLIGWTVFLWVSRLRNVLADDDLTGFGRGWRIGVVVLFVGLALAAAGGWWRRKSLPLVILIGWTALYWPVRGGGILIGDWSAGFKVVHTVLMVVSLGLAWLAWLAWSTWSTVRRGSAGTRER